MIIHQDCYNEEYTIIFYQEHIEVVINFIPEDNYNRGKLFFNLIPYFDIENTIIKYNNKIFYNQDELKSFFKSLSTNVNYHFKTLLTVKHSNHF